MEVEAYCVGMLVLITAVVIVQNSVYLSVIIFVTYTGCHLGGRTVPFKANSF